MKIINGLVAKAADRTTEREAAAAEAAAATRRRIRKLLATSHQCVQRNFCPPNKWIKAGNVCVCVFTTCYSIEQMNRCFKYFVQINKTKRDSFRNSKLIIS